MDSCLISYGELCKRAGLADVTSTVGQYLREIAQWCHDHGWPPLNSLAVNHQTRKPGLGYDNAPGCSVANWRVEAAACIGFAGYPEVILDGQLDDKLKT
jgi:hypothetical protein